MKRTGGRPDWLSIYKLFAWFLLPNTRRFQSRQAKFSCQHFVSFAKTAGHSWFIKSILKLLCHRPPPTIEQSLRVAKLTCSSLAAFALLTFSLRALSKKKAFWDASQIRRTLNALSFHQGAFFPLFEADVEDGRRNLKA